MRTLTSPWRSPAAWAALAIGTIALAGGSVAQAHPGPSVKAKLHHGSLDVRGTKANDLITLRLEAGQPGTLQVDVGDDGSADFSFDRAYITQIDVRAGAGDDVVKIDESNGAFSDTIPTTLRGGSGSDELVGGSGAVKLLGGCGADKLIGGNGNELLSGGPGNDVADGNRGADTAVLGSGDDTFGWDPGDGSDVVDGQGGSDTMIFNGAAAAEKIDLSRNGNRLKLFRDLGNITMDTAGVETVDVNPLGGADQVTVGDLARTEGPRSSRRPRRHAGRRRLRPTRRAARPADRGRHRQERRDRRHRRRVRAESERPRCNGHGSAHRRPERPARHRHGRGQGRRRRCRPGGRCDPALRERHPRPVAQMPAAHAPAAANGRDRVRPGPSPAHDDCGSTDRELMRRIRDRDQVAFEALYRRFARPVFGFALQRLRDPARAEDATQETFAAIWRSAAGYRPERGAVEPWLWAIARNAIVDETRKRSEPPAEAEDVPSGEPGPSEQAELEWVRWRVHSALAELPEHQRTLIELAYWGGLSQAEIAARLSMPLGTVKTRTRAALGRLAALLERDRL